MWIDTHCHIHGESDPILLARQARSAEVSSLICIGTDVPTSHQAIGVASAIESEIKEGRDDLPRAYSTVGLHPHDASNQLMAGVSGIEHLLTQNLSNNLGNIVGVGECGLDYFYEYSSKSDQQSAFRVQIELAKKFNLALVIHTRDSWEDTFSILKEQGIPEKFVFHCFTGDVELARRALDLGAYISFSGMVTFKNAEDIRAAASFVPLDRMVIETDSPYLAPVPYRGKTNVPAYVSVVGKFIAELRQAKIDEFSYATNKAATECFLLG